MGKSPSSTDKEKEAQLDRLRTSTQSPTVLTPQSLLNSRSTSDSLSETIGLSPSAPSLTDNTNTQSSLSLEDSSCGSLPEILLTTPTFMNAQSDLRLNRNSDLTKSGTNTLKDHLTDAYPLIMNDLLFLN